MDADDHQVEFVRRSRSRLVEIVSRSAQSSCKFAVAVSIAHWCDHRSVLCGSLLSLACASLPVRCGETVVPAVIAHHTSLLSNIGGSDVELDEGDDEGGSEEKQKETEKILTQDQDAGPISLEDNKCWLIWEGQLRDRAFSNFKPKSCPTDSAAKEVLGQKLAGYWDQAKNWKPEEEELF